MIDYLAHNWGTLVVGLIVLAIVSLIIRSMVIKKRQGKSITCDCGCEGCGSSSKCNISLPDSLPVEDKQFPT